ncbi:hypothetical protein Nepgr_000682 [Nepenthes gracilis]|uniref:Uncharacterized protein n=1 Tax=Nepenthes gracilis TaxID=150966 RepID=A0AAD3P3U6_NEPGR|nr:hypothetical protein Nepgr_000682 [Nepenthes gracilis]
MEGSIECSDQGVEFFETRVNCKLADILKKPQIETISRLFPVSSDESLNGAEIGCLLLIQFTTFDCGGTAIGTCFSHKVADACSIATFMNDWASIARDPSAVISPQFTGTSLFPLNDQKAISSKMMSADANCSTRRLVFYATKIDHLKARAQKGSSEAIQATRFEVISAIICKSITSAFRSLNLPEPGVLNVIVNLRKRMEPKLSNHHVGNFALHNLIEVAENERDLHGLVCLLKAGMAKFGENFTGKHTQYELSSKICESYDELGKLPRSNHGEMLLFSSWCRFPFYEVDFGSGKPAWVSSLPSPTKNCIFLCDSRKGDAVEAWVSLEDRVMNLFECDEELLAFASANPSPLEIEEDVNC